MIQDIFPGNSEMAQRMRALDWSRTPLGPVEQWPQSLQTSVSTCLDCAFPIVLWWGPDLAILYNDEYRQLLGPKHPVALGQPGLEVWSEIAYVIGPMLSQVYERGEATRSRDLLLHIDRGYPEEAYFSFSYSPIHGENGKVGGSSVRSSRPRRRSSASAGFARCATSRRRARVRRVKVPSTPLPGPSLPTTLTIFRSRCSTASTRRGRSPN